jgi:hypothetical protein
VSIQLNKRSAIVNEIIRRRLENGEMPTSADIIQMITDEATVLRSSQPTAVPPSTLYGQELDSNLVNKSIDDIELDMLSMRATLDEAWIALKSVVDKSMRTMPLMEREAEIVANTAIRALSLTPDADAVRVGRNAISVSAGIGFGSIDGIDMGLSDNIEIDLAAGALILERSSVSVIPAIVSPNDWTISGEYSVKIDKTIGDPTWTTDSNIAKTWTIIASTPSKYGRVTVGTTYKIANGSVPLKRIEILAPDFIQTDVAVYVDPDGKGNFTFWENSSGKGRILIDGETVHAKAVRIELSRYVAATSYYSGSRPMHEYSFQISEVVFVSSSYAASGNIVTDPIDLGVEQTISTIVDVDAVIPATGAVNTYVARDIPEPASIEDFLWILVKPDTKTADLMQIDYDIETIMSIAPIKIRTGAGQYSNSIYDVADIDGTVLRVDEGYGQLEVRKASPVVATEVAFLPTMTSLNWNLPASISVIPHEEATLSGANYYRLSTSVWAEVASSHRIELKLPELITNPGVTGADYAVFLNDANITDRLKDGSYAASFVSGRNNLVIYIRTGLEVADVDISLAEIPGCIMAIDRPSIVQETTLNSSEGRVAQVGKSLLVNHDTSGRVLHMMIKRTSGSKVDAIRLRIELKRGISGETPQVKSAYVTTGV